MSSTKNERCPNCGYCPHCGQGRPVYPVQPLTPWTPWYPQYPWYTTPHITWTTISSNAHIGMVGAGRTQ